MIHTCYLFVGYNWDVVRFSGSSCFKTSGWVVGVPVRKWVVGVYCREVYTPSP